MPIDFYRSKEGKTKLTFKSGEWHRYPENIRSYVNEFAQRRFVSCKPLTNLSDMEDVLLSVDEIQEISSFCKTVIGNIEAWDYSKEIYDELKRHRLKKGDVLGFFINLNTFLENAVNENDYVYSIGE